MLVIRLQRTGRENIPTYRLVVTEQSAPIRGKVKEYLGYYLPARNPHIFEYDTDRISHWIGMGARPSDTVARLLNKAGVKNMESFIKRYTKKRKKNAPEEPAVPAAGATKKDDTAEKAE